MNRFKLLMFSVWPILMTLAFLTRLKTLIAIFFAHSCFLVFGSVAGWMGEASQYFGQRTRVSIGRSKLRDYALMLFLLAIAAALTGVAKYLIKVLLCGP